MRPRRRDSPAARYPPNLVLPAVWDAWSAQTAAGAGFAALTVGSHPLATSRGAGDHASQSFQEVLDAVRRIAAVVDVPFWWN